MSHHLRKPRGLSFIVPKSGEEVRSFRGLSLEDARKRCERMGFEPFEVNAIDYVAIPVKELKGCILLWVEDDKVFRARRG